MQKGFHQCAADATVLDVGSDSDGPDPDDLAAFVGEGAADDIAVLLGDQAVDAVGRQHRLHLDAGEFRCLRLDGKA